MHFFWKPYEKPNFTWLFLKKIFWLTFTIGFVFSNIGTAKGATGGRFVK
jgi:hypothetical protein